MSRSWSVVKFLEDGCVEAVPSVWHDGELSSWPPVATKIITTLIKKCEPAASSWPKYKIKMLTRATFDTFLKARKKAKLGKDTSDLQSDEQPCKRRRIAKQFSSIEENLQESVLPLVPKLEGNSTNLDKCTLNGRSISFVEEHIEEHLEEHLKEHLQEQVGEIPRIESSSSSSTLNKNVVAVRTCSGCCERTKELKSLVRQIYLIQALVVNIRQEIRNLRKEILTG